MIGLKINSKQFMKEMDNMVDYSFGFLEGVNQGHPAFMNQLGATIIATLKEYIDSNARVNPQLLHHVYEWDQTGSPNARLFELSYQTIGAGLSFNSTFSQSRTVKSGSTVPFYDKARIMEAGIPVTIVPKKKVLAFEDNGETVFTSKEVRVENPGGMAQGEYERVFNSFFNRYFTQSFLMSSGILTYLQNPIDFDKNFSAGKRGGRSLGVQVGRSWIAKAGIL
jgi:hypothetical protein